MVLYKTVKKSYPIQNNQIALYSFSNSKMLPNRCQSAMLQAEKCGITPFLRSCFYMYPLAVPGISFAFARTFRPLRNKRLAASASGSASAIIPTRRGLNNSVYAILLFVSLSVLILRCICIILCQNALVIILLSRLITRIISPWIIWKWYANIIAYNLSYCNSKL